MKNNITEQALKNIRNRKTDNLQNYKLQIVDLEKDEQYLELEKKYTTLMIENRKKEVYGQNYDTNEEKQLLQQIQAVKEKYGLKDVKINYNCNKCKDEGYIEGKQCSCLKSEISKLLLEGSGFEKLENFAESSKTAGQLSSLYPKMQNWCNKVSPVNLIFFSGPTGVGKTHLLQCMANEFISNGKVVNIVTSLNLSIDFKLFSKNSDEELLRKYLTPDVLFIDDLGTEPIFRNITIEYLYLIINERKMRNRKTIITSNLTLNEISDRYDERLYSRFADQTTSIVIDIVGKDKRY